MSLATTKLSAADRKLLPTVADIEEYQRLGYYKSRKIFTDAEIDQVAAAQQRFYDTGAPQKLPQFEDPGEGTDLRWSIPGNEPGGMMKNDYVRFAMPEMDSFIRKPLFAAVAACMSGEPVRLWHEQLLYKPPSKGAATKAKIGWHTDGYYWQVNEAAHFDYEAKQRPQMVTGWVPFHDVGEVEGSICVVPKSHVVDPAKIRDCIDFFSSELESQEKAFKKTGIEFCKHTMLLKKGEVSFHHVQTIHGSGENQSDAPRRSIAIHLQPLSGKYNPSVKENGEKAVHHMDKRVAKDRSGRPDFSDPIWCPELGK